MGPFLCACFLENDKTSYLVKVSFLCKAATQESQISIDKYKNLDKDDGDKGFPNYSKYLDNTSRFPKSILPPKELPTSLIN